MSDRDKDAINARQLERWKTKVAVIKKAAKELNLPADTCALRDLWHAGREHGEASARDEAPRESFLEGVSWACEHLRDGGYGELAVCVSDQIKTRARSEFGEEEKS